MRLTTPLIAITLWLACSACSESRDSSGSASPQTGPVLVDLPAPPALDGIFRESSALDHQLLNTAPLSISPAGAHWQAGQLDLTPPDGSIAWGIFQLGGLTTDGSTYPTGLTIMADSQYWPAIADFETGAWRHLTYDDNGGYALDGAAALVSPNGNAYVALIGWQEHVSFSSVVLTTNEEQPPASEPVLGINMEKIGAVSIGWTFVDVFKMSEPFISTTPGGAPNPAPLDLDAQGWPRTLQSNQAATAIFLRQQQGYRPPGQYVLLYDGSGSISVVGDAQLISQSPGRMLLDIVPGSNGDRCGIRIVDTDPAEHLRNIRIVPLAHEADYAELLFSPEFLAPLESFSVVRFLNWNAANNSAVMTTDDLTAPDYQTQAMANGAAYEYMCELCNRLGADLWVNVPHMADDACVAQIASLLRDGLDPALRVYIEHSNEVWSDGFSQGPWCEQQGLALGLSPDPFSARMRFHSQHSLHIFELFELAFGGRDRLVRVMGAAHHDGFTVTEPLDWQDAYLSCDAVSTAPYIGGRLGRDPFAPLVREMSVTEVIDEMRIDSANSAAFTAAHAAEAQARGLRYIAYEGGQALYAQGAYVGDSQLTSLFNAVNRDSGMRQLHLDHLSAWRANGGELFMAFNYIGRFDQSGNWGLLEHQTQGVQTAYKYLGVLDYAGQFP